MDPFVWDDNFVTGIKQVDRQHQHLVGVVNEFGELLAQNELQPMDIERVFAELTAYAKYHFDEEEREMKAGRVDTRHVDTHVELHCAFIDEVEALRSDVGHMPGSTSKLLLDFLVHWIAYHILDADRRMAAQLRSIGEGTEPAEAYEAYESRNHASTEPLLKALTGLFEVVSARNKLLRDLNSSLETKVAERTEALQTANQRLEELALTDVLTDLPNRRSAMRGLRDFWDQSNEQVQSLSCLMIDVDGFKQVNDTLGHEAGDAFLRGIAKTLKNAVRTDDMVCRLGGDEFLIICPSTPLEGAMRVAESCRTSVSDFPCPPGANLVSASISVGVAARNAEMKNPDALIRAADEGAYLAKRDGKNCVRTVAKCE